MALSNTVLAGLIEDEISAVLGSPSDAAQLNKVATAIATAIVDHINDAAEVVIPGGSSAGTYGVE